MTLSFPGRRPAFGHAFAIGGVLVATAVYPQTFGREGEIRAVATATDAYIPAPTRLVAAEHVDDIAPDPRGRYVLVSRRDPPPIIADIDRRSWAEAGHDLYDSAVSLLLYDSQTGRVRTIWEQSAPDVSNPVQGSVGGIHWFPGTDIAVAVVTTMQTTTDEKAVNDPNHATQRLLLIQPSSASRRYAQVLQASSIWPEMAHTGNAMALLRIGIASADGKTMQLHYETLDARGNLAELTEIDANHFHMYESSRDGRVFYFYRRAHPDEARTSDAETPEFRYIAFDVQTRKTVDIDRAPPDSPLPSPERALSLTSGQAIAKLPVGPSTATSTSTLIKPLFLVCNPKAANKTGLPGSIMVAPHADSSVLLADDSAALYQFQRTLYAVPLVRLPLNDYNALLRERVMANAKSLALAMKGYSEDYDGFLPNASGVNDRISPYVKSESMYEDPATGAMSFHYQLDGQTLAGIKSPDTRVEGSLDCVFGQATIYADGHVVWNESHQVL